MAAQQPLHPLFMVHMTAYLAQQAGLEASADTELGARVAAVASAVPWRAAPAAAGCSRLPS